MTDARTPHDPSSARRRGVRVLALLAGMSLAFMIGGPAGLAVFASVVVIAAVVIYSRRP